MESRTTKIATELLPMTARFESSLATFADALSWYWFLAAGFAASYRFRWQGMAPKRVWSNGGLIMRADNQTRLAP